MEGVGTNRYAYAGQDPVNKADANGHFSISYGWSAELTPGVGFAYGFGITLSVPDPWSDDVMDAQVDGSLTGTMGLSVGAGFQAEVDDDGTSAKEQDDASDVTFDAVANGGLGVYSVQASAPIEKDNAERRRIAIEKFNLSGSFLIQPTERELGLKTKSQVGFSIGLQASGKFSVRDFVRDLFDMKDEASADVDSSETPEVQNDSDSSISTDQDGE